MTQKAGITEHGFVKKTYSEILEDYKKIAESIYGKPLDLAEYTPQGQLIQVFAYQNALFWDLLESLYYAGYIGSSSGNALDQLIAIIGVQRNEAKPSIGEITIYGLPGTVISQNTIICDPDNFHRFKPNYPVTIPESQEITVPITSVFVGYEHNVPAGKLTTTFPPTAKFTVYNHNPTIHGRDLENDTQLRNRSLIGANTSVFATPNAILSYISAHPSIEYADLEEREVENTFKIFYSGTIPVEDLKALIDEKRAAGISYTIEKLNDALITIRGTLQSTNPLQDINLISQTTNAIDSYLKPMSRGESLTWSGLYRHLSKTLDHLKEIQTMDVESSEHETTISNFGDTFNIESGLKFKTGQVLFWIHGQTYTVSLSCVAESATLSQEECSELFQTTFDTLVGNLPMGSSLDWNTVYNTLLDIPGINAIHYLHVSTNSKTASHPDSSIQPLPNYKLLPTTDPLSFDTATPIPVSLYMKLIVEEAPILPALPDAAQPITNALWSTGKETPFTHTDIQNIIPVIEESNSSINSVYSIELEGNSATATNLTGIIPCNTGEILVPAPYPTIITGFKSGFTLKAAFKRASTESDPETLKSQITSAITTHFKDKMPGDPISWDDINNMILGDSDIAQTLSMDLYSQPNAFGISEPGSEISIPITHFPVPVSCSINIYDTHPVTITLTATPIDKTMQIETVQSHIASRITDCIYSINETETGTLSWTGLKSAILLNSDMVASIDSLEIGVKNTSLTTTDHHCTLDPIDYLIPGSYSLTINVSGA